LAAWDESGTDGAGLFVSLFDSGTTMVQTFRFTTHTPIEDAVVF